MDRSQPGTSRTRARGSRVEMIDRATLRSSRIALVGCLVTVVAGSLVAAANAANRVYWGGYGSSNKISFANLNGSGGGDLNTTGATVDEPFGIAIDLATGRILWANDGGNRISFANLNNTGGGGNLNTTGARESDAEGMAIDRGAGRIN